MSTDLGVSFVVPVYNGERWLDQVLDAIEGQRDGRPFEVIVIDDGSTDRSREILERRSEDGSICLLDGEGRGSTSALNLGIRRARHPVVCQVDQDVVVQPGWMAALIEEFGAGEDRPPRVAAVQGYYETDRQASVWARVMGYDLQLRWAAIRGSATNHVCTGTTAYWRGALEEVGLFSESMGYGYDNDMSYRLQRAGYGLIFCRRARSLHHWRPNLRGYLAQQYGVGYGRLEVIAAHPDRATGDNTSGLTMILHVPLTLAVVVASLLAVLFAAIEAPWRILACLAGIALAAIIGERLTAGIRAAVRFRDPAAGLMFPMAHVLRNLVWIWALTKWTVRRLLGRSQQPADTMSRNPGDRGTTEGDEIREAECEP